MALREPGDGPPPLPLLVTLLCALCGGVLASLLGPGLGWLRALVVVPVCAAVGAAVAYWLLTSPRPSRSTSPPRAPGPAVDQDAGPARPVTEGPDHTWWTESPRPTRAPVPVALPGAATVGVATAPLPGDGEQPPLVAQCPRCGEFRLDVQRNGPAYAFRCHHPGCGHTWGWMPGTAWPPVVVRRNLATAPLANHGQQPRPSR